MGLLMSKLTLGLFVTIALASSVPAQQSESDRKSNQPIKPFRVIGKIYYVGANEVTSFLIAGSGGHILLDAGFAETAPQIRQNIETLGFRVADVKFLLNSQAHFDHAGGLAKLKALAGAHLVASSADAELLARGGKGDFAFGDRLAYEPVKADRLIADGDSISVGDTKMTAHLTPGHTRAARPGACPCRKTGKLMKSSSSVASPFPATGWWETSSIRRSPKTMPGRSLS
jgi:metallo-beta-lactamase class B